MPAAKQPTLPEPKRIDAVRNRERIIHAAFRVLGEIGVDAQMADIAAAAGLGVGTVYRNFPSKEVLVNALVQDRLTHALEAIDRVESRDLPAWDGLVKIIRSVTERQMENRVLSQFLSGRIAGSPQLQAQRDEVYARLDKLVQQAQAEKKLRRDVGVSDIRLALVSLTHIASNDESELARRIVRRQLSIIIDGLRAPARSRLEGPPLTIAESEDAFGSSSHRASNGLKRGRRRWPT